MSAAGGWRAREIPVHLVTGLLGSGKTTLVQALLATPSAERWAVLVNEFGERGFDGEWLRRQHAGVAELAGGCMGCSGAVALPVTLNRLLRQTRPTRVLVEASGAGHPAEILALLRGTHYRGILQPAPTLCVVDPQQLRPESAVYRQQLAVAEVLVGSRADGWSAAEHARFEALAASRPQARAVKFDGAKASLDWLRGPVQPLPAWLPSGAEAVWQQTLQWRASGGLTLAQLAALQAALPGVRIKGEVAAAEGGHWRLNSTGNLQAPQWRPGPGAGQVQLLGTRAPSLAAWLAAGWTLI